MYTRFRVQARQRKVALRLSVQHEPSSAPRHLRRPKRRGKTSHSHAILDSLKLPTFINADPIARGLIGCDTGRAALHAGRITLLRLRTLAAAREDYDFDGTLANRSFVNFVKRCKAAGYLVSISYFSLHRADVAVRRMARRIVMGGHGSPEDVIGR